MPLVLVRTPTYRRPDLLRRAIGCLRAQTHEDWICEVRDDCPDASARAVVEEMGDPRVRYVHNRPQKFMVRNLDDCFLRDNPHGADYFFMLEDDNQVLPAFMTRGIELIETHGVTICQMNQVVEHRDAAGGSRLGDAGILDATFDERVHRPEEMHLAILGAIGLSNGGVFWSKRIGRELAVGVDTLPTLEEYLRTALVAEPVCVSHEKLAIWASNEAATSRNAGLGKGWLRRELDLKASVTALQRAVWAKTPEGLREAFLAGGLLRIPLDRRLEALRKAGIRGPGIPSTMGVTARVKRLAVRGLGRQHPSVDLAAGA